MKDSATGKFHGNPSANVVVDNKSVNSGNITKTETNIIDPRTQDVDPVTITVAPKYGRMSLYGG